MSLSARIAVGPSLRVALLAAAVVTGGFIAAGVTAAACLPEATAIAPGAAAGWMLAIASMVRRHRTLSRIVLSVSDRAEIGVDGRAEEHPWRLVEPTMAWCGFAVVALAESDASPRSAALRYPLCDADVAPADRRALSRFLLWSLRGGATSMHS